MRDPAGRPPPRSRRALGQHFLSDTRILRRIVAALEPVAADVVVEIGPGTGSLTRELAPRVARVIAIEKDRRLAAECGMRNAECRIDNVEVLTADALALDWQSLVPHSVLRTPHFKIVGNIPYYITGPLLEKALQPPLPERVVFLVQAEVADRIVAKPGSKSFGALSVGVQVVCRVERLFRVAAGAFQPPPAVDSAVVRLRPRGEPTLAVEEIAAFRRFVVGCFGRRRKQLRNVLRGLTGWPAQAVDEMLAVLGVEPAVRPEALSPASFVGLWRETLRRGARL